MTEKNPNLLKMKQIVMSPDGRALYGLAETGEIVSMRDPLAAGRLDIKIVHDPADYEPKPEAVKPDEKQTEGDKPGGDDSDSTTEDLDESEGEDSSAETQESETAEE